MQGFYYFLLLNAFWRLFCNFFNRVEISLNFCVFDTPNDSFQNNFLGGALLASFRNLEAICAQNGLNKTKPPFIKVSQIFRSATIHRLALSRYAAERRSTVEAKWPPRPPWAEMAKSDQTLKRLNEKVNLSKAKNEINFLFLQCVV